MGKKSKGFGDFARQSKSSEYTQKQLQLLQKKLLKTSPNGSEVILTPEGEVKTSDLLLEFIKPYLGFAKTEAAFHKLVTTGALAWNFSLFDKSEQQHIFEQFFQKEMPEVEQDVVDELKQILEELMVRKKRYFSEHKQLITDFTAKEKAGKFHLTVAFYLPNPE